MVSGRGRPHRPDRRIQRSGRRCGLTSGLHVDDDIAAAGQGHSLWTPKHAIRVPPARTAALLVVVGAVCFGGAAVLVHLGTNHLDERLFRALNDVPMALTTVLTPLSKLFLPVGLLIAIGLAVLYLSLRYRSGAPVLVGASAAAVAWALAKLSKAVAQRPRPYEVLHHAVLRQHPAHGTSFPSSHTSVAVATVVALLPFLPRRFAPVAVVYAALVGWSRIYLGVHYPLDIVGGTGIGLAVGGTALLVVRRVIGPGPAEALTGAGRPG